MLRRIRPLIAFAAIAIGVLALAQPGAGHPTSQSVTPHWSCRASALQATLVGGGQRVHVEPAAANGNATTGADLDQCQSDDALFPNPTLNVGNDSGKLVEEAPFANTRICSANSPAGACPTDFSYNEKVLSTAGAERLTLAGSGHSIEVTAVRSTAAGSCQNGQPLLSGASRLASLIIDGNNVTDQIDNGQQKVFGDGQHLIIVVNEQTKGPDTANGGAQLTQRALHIVLAQDPANYLEVILGEAKVGYHGDATQLCTPPAARCPAGSTFDQTRGVCVLTVVQQAPCPENATRDANGACIITVGPPSTAPGTGGNVVPLGQVLGVRAASPCRNKRFGRQVAIVGTSRGDRITGSNRSDRIFTFGGNDRVSGGRGNDCIEGGTGSDQLDGSNGSDWLIGQAGNDQLSGGQRNDYLYGGAGNDKLIGGSGNDHIFGGRGRNKLDGGKGNDVMVGGPQRDFITGGNGRDVVRAGGGNDTINVATAGPASKVDCGPGVDSVRINNNEINHVKNCEHVFVTTRLANLRR